MTRPSRIRSLTAAGAFVLAAIAGWYFVPEAEVAKPRVIPLSAVKPVAPPAKPNETQQAAMNSGEAAVATLEKYMLAALDPPEGPYSGERLMELCLVDHPSDLPGPHEAFSYARLWAAKAPREMFDWFQKRGQFTLPARDSNYGFLPNLFSEWTKSDPTAAIAAALECHSRRDRPDALRTVIEHLKTTDPARAAAVAAEHLGVIADDQFKRTFSAYGEKYRETWDFLVKLPAGKDRGTVLARFFEEVARYHGADCPQLWRELPEATRREIVAGGFTGIYLGDSETSKGSPASLDGVEDLRRQHIETTGDATAARQFIRTNGRQWAERDPTAAIAWAQQHLKGEQRVTGTAQLFNAGAAGDLDATLRAWQSLPDGILKAQAAGSMAAGAPAARTAEMEALLAGLSLPDQNIANAARQTAVREQRQREDMEQLRQGMRRSGGG